jgi:hypothetical protein
MGPDFAKKVPPRKPDAKRERVQQRADAAMQAGWVIRFDPDRLEYRASRELHTARTLEALLNAIEAADGAG